MHIRSELTESYFGLSCLSEFVLRVDAYHLVWEHTRAEMSDLSGEAIKSFFNSILNKMK